MASVVPDADDDQVDESEPVVCEDLVAEGSDAKPNIDFATVPGYNNVRLDQSLLPPPPMDYIPPKDQKQPDFMSAPVISEETARQALLEYAAQQCCWGKGSAEKLTFKQLQSSTSYHYVLETFTEERSTKWDYDPFHGQHVDGPEFGPAPGPWDISATFKEFFKNETQHHEVPHTAYVKDCHKCNARGYVRCGKCHGRGRVKCGSCHGSGRKRVYRKGEHRVVSCSRCHGRGKRSCMRCGGDGRVKCPVCKSHCRLRWYIKLTINWMNNIGEHIVEKTELPDILISQAAGTMGFEDTQPRVIPIARFPVPEINDASARLVGSHQFPNRRIHMQHHIIRMVPVTQCFCQLKEKDMKYFVYGLESRVHAPEYPDKCCWGCTIL
ncbi:protein SSUH2 homolog [Ostrea edulis]|uniref:protein SSUH2 homolog n=1 Tax=Ostrea edulis TaxID=37623 RepID=UPI0024AFA4F7|nr:protein SSUH2 homolog [Ostrea edulis]